MAGYILCQILEVGHIPEALAAAGSGLVDCTLDYIPGVGHSLVAVGYNLSHSPGAADCIPDCILEVGHILEAGRNPALDRSSAVHHWW